MSTTRKWCMAACFGLLCLLMVSVMVRALTTNVLMSRLHIYNGITMAILFDNAELRSIGMNVEDVVGKSGDVPVKWNELFPFKEEPNQVSSAPEKEGIAAKISKKLQAKPNRATQKVSRWTNDRLLGYEGCVELYNAYKNLLHWNITPRKEYNGVVEIEGGQLTTYQDREDMSERIKNTTSLARFCKEHDAAFLYVLAPGKIDRHDEKYKMLDFSNANADAFFAGLKENGVDYIDIRDNIDAEGFTNKDLFFRTDHHWLPEAGLWATGIVVRYLNEKGLLQSDVSLLEPQMWNREVYKNFFLGSQGRKVTLQRTTPDDITIYHPKFPTHFHMEIPSKAISQDGDFDSTYDKRPLEKVDYYYASPYGAYSLGGMPYMYIRNKDAENGKTILLLRDSFGQVVLPFLALQFKHVYQLDLRSFNGSVQEVIRQKKPDVVMVLYHIGFFSGDVKVNYETHTSPWDFR